jgi:MFS family permease
VLVVRFVDRIGKGVRTAPRDAMLARVAPPEARGRVYSFHRAMDHAGAVAGPMIAAAFLWAWPGQYRTLFALTLIPGLFVIVLLFRLPLDTRGVDASSAGASPGSGAMPTAHALPSDASPDGRPEREQIPGSLWRVFVVFTVFALGNSTDAYLLLRLGQALEAASLVSLAWAGLHAVKVTTSLAGGMIADRLGRKLSVTLGWSVYALVYTVFAVAGSPLVLGVAFFAYGAYFGFTEGAERALVADLSPTGLQGTAFGFYNAVIGIGALAASVAFGLLWERFGSPVAFAVGAMLALLATVLLWLMVPTTRVESA